MKPAPLACCLILAIPFASVTRADTADTAIVAAMKLSSAPNYSWTTSIEQGARTTGETGKTNESGFSLVTFTNATTTGTSAGSGRTGNGGDTNTVFLGDSKYVV